MVMTAAAHVHSAVRRTARLGRQLLHEVGTHGRVVHVPSWDVRTGIATSVEVDVDACTRIMEPWYDERGRLQEQEFEPYRCPVRSKKYEPDQITQHQSRTRSYLR